MTEKSKKVRWWERLAARTFGMAILRKPDDKRWIEDPEKDSVMAFHWCPGCRSYRFDRHYDALSRSARFQCGGCGTARFSDGEEFGVSPLKIAVCAEIAASRARPKFLAYLLFLKLLFFGLGKHLPLDRGGKTAGELETEAALKFAAFMMRYFSVMDRLPKA